MASLAESSLVQRREVSDAIKTKVDGALATLTEIWDEVGLSPQQQEKILVNMREQVFGQVERLVQEEDQIRSQYKEEIATSREKISSICSELGIAVPEVSLGCVLPPPHTRTLGGSARRERTSTRVRVISARGRERTLSRVARFGLSTGEPGDLILDLRLLPGSSRHLLPHPSTNSHSRMWVA